MPRRRHLTKLIVGTLTVIAAAWYLTLAMDADHSVASWAVRHEPCITTPVWATRGAHIIFVNGQVPARSSEPAPAAPAAQAGTFAATGEPSLQRSAPPRWIRKTAWKENRSEFVVVKSGLWATPDEAIADAARDAARVVYRYVAASAPGISEEQISTTLVRERFVRDIHVREEPKDYGTMYRAWLLVELKPSNRALIVHQVMRERQRQLWARTLGILAIMFTAGICLLGYTKLDDLTLGYYRTPLRVVTTLFFLVTATTTLWLSGWLELLTGR